ncbi:uncharacterized protein MONOS_11905 [Monocercomonoides exilis]|uniref:uncharacterized protein n=1 Tax=Monocercomonoides exilis TaxID=2049356 RepID=UPI00355A64C6|nr:hypothetical protein MONOS_11905 [Monocercomonoides exilis]|eukprot:MONOS_11905.1-p1 / transcript=MONOS_11905.1 / gene=MONOS_11905 / organism=Monocercomonoides_exilis_PA203 / gene_product=unspecified product / transcript_product=unspecified product / location=Mono_scaffold00623:19278-19562(-) / protein_length=95 / sequence_SO=supercontig / SO=protein_coding / is_pseudo=false
MLRRELIVDAAPSESTVEESLRGAWKDDSAFSFERGDIECTGVGADEVAAGGERKYTNGKDIAGVLEVVGMHTPTEFVERDGSEDEMNHAEEAY